MTDQLNIFLTTLAASYIIFSLFLFPMIEDLLTKNPDKLTCEQVHRVMVNGTGDLTDRMIEKYTANYVARCLPGEQH